MKLSRYSFIGRVISAIHTFNDKKWLDGTKFTFKKRISRTVLNFRDKPGDPLEEIVQ